MKKLSLLLLIIIGAISAGVALAQTTTDTSSLVPPVVVTNSKPSVGIKITVDQLKAAGFTDAVVAAPVGTRFSNANFYFKVKETSIGAAGWGDSANLVSVLVRPVLEKGWSYNNGQVELLDFAGRIQTRVSSLGYYVVVTGPNKEKVLSLINTLKELY